ncbi:MAG TPA: LLM class flavin-dependent oxidoreductase, partial [Thermoanaerobaculia bacterium]|nr:LLM class flavin-dependent oxidoreductase [Thermoanaerobaculia bacterium]
MQIELGLDTFGDITPDATHAEVLRNVVEEAVLADELGVDFIGLGEHHRPDFAISAPEIVLAAIASRTKRIHLGTSVTVLSTDDPIRVFERFSTLNAISNGRAEIILGRGSFTESFPLFGFDLNDYETLFEEKVGRLAKALENDRTGAGQRVYPPIAPASLKIWIGVGGSPESVVRAARYRFPLMLAIIGGDPKRFLPYVDLYERALGQSGSERLEVGVHSPGHIADSDTEAREQLWPAYREMRNRIGAERGWPPTSRAEFDREIESGSLYAGSPETVAQKIASTVRLLALSRFDLKYSSGP